MVVKVPRVRLHFHRDGKRINVEPGKAFDFKPSEIKAILEAHADPFREPIVERAGQPAADTHDLDPNMVRELEDQKKDAETPLAAGPTEDDEI